MQADLPVWRSMLFVPVTVPRFIAKAAERGADALILDLEDSVAPTEKARARETLPDAVVQAGRRGADIVVRVNRPWRLLVRDLEAAVIPGVAALALTKVDSPEHVRAVAEIVADLESERGLPPGGIRFMALVETPGGVFRIEAIAASHPRMVAISIGAEDLALSLGMLPEAEGLFYPKQQSIFAARAAGILPLGFVGTVAAFDDLAAYRAALDRARRLGFEGASCIHPSQVPILNAAFSPAAAEVDRATRMVAAYDAALASGVGAISFEGRMIDIPVVERARELLRRAERVAQAARRATG